MATTKIIERGDIFASPCRVLVNPVNCVGVSGKGLAKEFKRRFPLSVKAYEKDCRDYSAGRSLVSNLWLGSPTEYALDEHGKIIMFFATKLHWKEPSQLDDIDDGLCALAGNCIVDPARYPSVAIPALGCGLGQLSWRDVLPLIQETAGEMNKRGIDVEVYAPLEGT
jgi:O-acetyl-ADP-ribose deacetylase (regulator of RNase III)